MTILHKKLDQFYREANDRYLSESDMTMLIEIDKVRQLGRIAHTLEQLWVILDSCTSKVTPND